MGFYPIGGGSSLGHFFELVSFFGYLFTQDSKYTAPGLTNNNTLSPLVLIPQGMTDLSFDSISKTLTRARTPPPESMPPTPMATPFHSHPTSPDSSRGPSPFGTGMLNADPFADFDADDDFLRQMLASSMLDASGAPDLRPEPPMAPHEMHTVFEMEDYSGLLAPANSPTPFLDGSMPLHDVAGDDEAHAHLEALLGGDQLAHLMPVAPEPLMSVSAPVLTSEETTSIPPPAAPVSDDVPAPKPAPKAAALGRRPPGRPPGRRPSSESGSSTSSGSPPSKRSKPEAVKAKRESHNTSERQRRQALKSSFEDLRVLVPAVAAEPRIHTGQILRAAIDYLEELRHEEAALVAAKAKLKAQNRALKARVARR